MGDCEGCGKKSPAGQGRSYDLFDFCAKCGANLCHDCMAKGHCGSVPAVSGMDADMEIDESK